MTDQSRKISGAQTSPKFEPPKPNIPSKKLAEKTRIGNNSKHDSGANRPNHLPNRNPRTQKKKKAAILLARLPPASACVPRRAMETTTANRAAAFVEFIGKRQENHRPPREKGRWSGDITHLRVLLLAPRASSRPRPRPRPTSLPCTPSIARISLPISVLVGDATTRESKVNEGDGPLLWLPGRMARPFTCRVPLPFPPLNG